MDVNEQTNKMGCHCMRTLVYVFEYTFIYINTNSIICKSSNLNICTNN